MPVTRMTSVFEVPEGPDWTLVAQAFTFVAIQVRTGGVVQVHLQGDGEANPGEEDGFLTLARGSTGTESAFSAGGLPANTSIWARSSKGAEQISVIAY